MLALREMLRMEMKQCGRSQRWTNGYCKVVGHCPRATRATQSPPEPLPKRTLPQPLTPPKAPARLDPELFSHTSMAAFSFLSLSLPRPASLSATFVYLNKTLNRQLRDCSHGRHGTARLQ